MKNEQRKNNKPFFPPKSKNLDFTRENCHFTIGTDPRFFFLGGRRVVWRLLGRLKKEKKRKRKRKRRRRGRKKRKKEQQKNTTTGKTTKKKRKNKKNEK